MAVTEAFRTTGVDDGLEEVASVLPEGWSFYSLENQAYFSPRWQASAFGPKPEDTTCDCCGRPRQPNRPILLAHGASPAEALTALAEKLRAVEPEPVHLSLEPQA